MSETSSPTTLESDLLSKLTPDGPERGGVIIAEGLVEITNICGDEDGYAPDPDELVLYIDQMIGTFHTHPGQTANLSVEDFNTYLQFPGMRHAIVGTDGVRWYEAKGGAVVNA
jgi:hypothetical protein